MFEKKLNNYEKAVVIRDQEGRLLAGPAFASIVSNPDDGRSYLIFRDAHRSDGLGHTSCIQEIKEPYQKDGSSFVQVNVYTKNSVYKVMSADSPEISKEDRERLNGGPVRAFSIAEDLRTINERRVLQNKTPLPAAVPEKTNFVIERSYSSDLNGKVLKFFAAAKDYLRMEIEKAIGAVNQKGQIESIKFIGEDADLVVDVKARMIEEHIKDESGNCTKKVLHPDPEMVKGVTGALEELRQMPAQYAERDVQMLTYKVDPDEISDSLEEKLAVMIGNTCGLHGDLKCEEKKEDGIITGMRIADTHGNRCSIDFYADRLTYGGLNEQRISIPLEIKRMYIELNGRTPEKVAAKEKSFLER